MSSFFINLEKETKERFSLSKFMEWTDNYDPLTSIFLKRLSSISHYALKEVFGEDGRIDLFAYREMNHVEYWWILLAYNKKLYFDDIKTGDILRIPTPDELEALFFSLKELETIAKR